MVWATTFEKLRKALATRKREKRTNCMCKLLRVTHKFNPQKLRFRLLLFPFFVKSLPHQ